MDKYCSNQQTVLVLDYGGQYKELIAAAVRKLHVYSEIRPGNITAEEVRALAPVGIVLTGGPKSVYKDDAPLCDPALLELGIPVLGICYGMQLLAHMCGGAVAPARSGEYGKTKIEIDPVCPLFDGIPQTQTVLMSHFDAVQTVPDGFVVTARTHRCPVAAIACPEKKLYGVQFHPEVKHTPCGETLLRNFLYTICGARGKYALTDFAETAATQLQRQIGRERVLLALSGGVDSSVCAALIARAIPGQLTCVFVDHGLLRKGEADSVEAVFSKQALHFVRVNAAERFLCALRGVTDPEKKRKIIGEQFIRVFEEQAKQLGDIAFLAQGTIYPDVIESGGSAAATIKSHHNVGGLPENIGFRGLLEPLRGLFKDEVRAVGRQLGLPDTLTDRQPFPGPGLAVRILGDITAEKLELLRNADAIVREEIDRLRHRPDQYFAVLPGIRTVGVVGDERAYDHCVGIRAVTTQDFMTAVYAPLPHRVLAKISARISNEVPGAGRVVYDISGKPPATVEWE